MQLTKNDDLNDLISEIHNLIVKTIPHVVYKEIPGYRSNQYGISASMKSSVCYVICYDQKANLGFDQGSLLQKEFPILKGTGKLHRHLAITKEVVQNPNLLVSLIKKAFSFVA